mgnify:CR=1 FL=1
MADKVYTAASPSLALVKYWGKADAERNLPATTSLGVTLAGLETRTAVSILEPGNGATTDRAAEPTDQVTLNGAAQPTARFAPFFDHLRSSLSIDYRFLVESYNTFPTAAGLASSSSGFAALALGCSVAAGAEGWARAPETISALALRGSASASRAVYEGFTLLPAGAERASPLFRADHWPDLRILAVATTTAAKAVSSRAGMTRSAETSPYYSAWVADSARLAEEVRESVASRDIERLGAAMRLSYLRMVGTMISADPPFMYWLSDSIQGIRACEELRKSGIAAWETMDAGPQVKILTTTADLDTVRRAVVDALPTAETYETRPGAGARMITEREYTAGDHGDQAEAGGEQPEGHA